MNKKLLYMQCTINSCEVKKLLRKIRELKKIVINFAMTFLQFGEGWG
jgi:hypothetical protein